MIYTYEQKKEARDFLTLFTKVNLDNCDPAEFDNDEVEEIRSSFPFRIWIFSKKLKSLLQKIKNDIIN